MQRAIALYVLLRVIVPWGGWYGRCDAAPEPGAKSVSVPAPVVTHHAMQIHGHLLRYTATAGLLPITDEHGKTKAEMFFVDLRKTLAKVQGWAIAEYLPALAQGHELPDAERQKIITNLAEYTGLSQSRSARYLYIRPTHEWRRADLIA